MNSLIDYDTFINGKWKKTHFIPNDKTRLSMFTLISDKIKKQLCALCSKDQSNLGNLYRIALNLQQNSKISPWLISLLKDCDQIATLDEFVEMSWKCYVMDIPAVFFIFSIVVDLKNNKQYIPSIRQATLGLSDNYYSDTTVCSQYATYIKTLCHLYGFSVDSNAIVNFEKKIIDLHISSSESRDVDKVYNIILCQDLPKYFNIFKNQGFNKVIVDNLVLLDRLEDLLSSTPIQVLKDFLIFKVANSYAIFQSKIIKDTKFEFYEKTLNGRQKQQDAQLYALNIVKKILPTALQQLYIKHYFDENTKKQCFMMLQNIIATLQESITNLSWMTPETKRLSLNKIKNIQICVAYPEKWELDYAISCMTDDMPCMTDDMPCMTDVRLDFSKYYSSFAMWIFKKNINKFGTIVDRNRWNSARAYDVNAYYDHEYNRIIIPAGIMQKPFFGFSKIIQNYGALGCVIGHELTHGFDDQGRKFNPEGKLLSWWSQKDIDTYENRAELVENFYSSKIIEGTQVNGSLTLGENLADIGGIILSIRALKRLNFNNFNNFKLFFESYAKMWRALTTKETTIKYLNTNHHSPNNLRINVVVTHIPEFYSSYGVKLTNKEIRELEKFSIW